MPYAHMLRDLHGALEVRPIYVRSLCTPLGCGPAPFQPLCAPLGCGPTAVRLLSPQPAPCSTPVRPLSVPCCSLYDPFLYVSDSY